MPEKSLRRASALVVRVLSPLHSAFWPTEAPMRGNAKWRNLRHVVARDAPATLLQVTFFQRRVAKGRLKKPEKIGAAVQRALQKNHGYRCYAWELKEGQLEIFEHPLNLPREKKHEGKSLIQTDQQEMTPEEAVAHYKSVERGGTQVPVAEGSAGNASHLAPHGPPCEGTRFRSGVGLLDRADVLIERMLERDR